MQRIWYNSSEIRFLANSVRFSLIFGYFGGLLIRDSTCLACSTFASYTSFIHKRREMCARFGKIEGRFFEGGRSCKNRISSNLMLQQPATCRAIVSIPLQNTSLPEPPPRFATSKSYRIEISKWSKNRRFGKRTCFEKKLTYRRKAQDMLLGNFGLTKP